MTLTKDEQAYFVQLASQMVTTLGAGALDAFKADPVGTIQRAHEQRQEFAFEMLDGCTDRAKMAHKALTASIYSNVNGRNSVPEALSDCAQIACMTSARPPGFEY